MPESQKVMNKLIWSRLVHLEKSMLTIKRELSDYLSLFSLYLRSMEGEVLAVQVETHPNTLELEVTALDFIPEKVDSYYAQFVAFYADPVLLEKVTKAVKQRKKLAQREWLLNHVLPKLQQTISELNQAVKHLEQKHNLTKQDIVSHLAHQTYLEQENVYLKEIIKNLSQKNMSAINIHNSTINNNGVLNFGHIFDSVRNSVDNLSFTSEFDSETTSQIQNLLLEILEKIKTNQELPGEQKIQVLQELQTIAEEGAYNKPTTVEKVKESLQNLGGMLQAIASGKELFDQLKELAKLFGISI